VIEVFGQAFSWKDMILIAGGLFLLWKATTEIHHSMDPAPEDPTSATSTVTLGFAAAIGQILMLDMVFSIDSIITAVGMTEHLPIMIIAVVVSVLVMLLAADPGQVHQRQPDGGDAGPGLPDHDRHDADRRRLRRPRTERLRLRRHGVLGCDRGVEHDVPPRPAEAGLRGSLIGAERNGRLHSKESRRPFL
jgi:hypothetical protein